MSHSPIPNDPLRAGGADPLGGAASKPSAKKSEGSTAFRALLDNLAQKATDLGQASQSVGAPEDLADAVENARKSLEDAMSLGDSLLEAYRANQLQEPKSGSEEV